MTKEELREHCEKQVKACEMWAKHRGIEPSGKVYEEHKLILDLIKALEQEPSEDCVSRQPILEELNRLGRYAFKDDTDYDCLFDFVDRLPLVTPTHRWIPLVWDEYPTVDSEGNDDWVYSVDYSVPMPEEDEWVLITDENHNVRVVQYDGYDFGDYVREHILAWAPSPMPYKD